MTQTPYRYHAFVSYSHSADATFAPRFHAALQGFARPWYRVRALRVFRDRTNLAANPDLWGMIVAALDNSEFLLYLASPAAARSHWVQKELKYWLDHRNLDSLVLVATEGNLDWDAAACDFDWNITNALPDALRGSFEHEPLFADFRGLKGQQLSLRDPKFLDSIATVAATLHKRSKDEIFGEDVRQHRRTIRLAIITSIILSALTIAASVLGALSWRRGNALVVAIGEVRKQRGLAEEGEAKAIKSNYGNLIGLSYRDWLANDIRGWQNNLLKCPRSLRHWEWGYIQNLCYSELYKLATNDIEPLCVEFCPTGNALAVGFAKEPDSGVVHLWNSATLEQTASIDAPSGAVRAVTFNQDGSLLAFAAGRHIVVCDAGTGLKLSSFREHEAQITDIHFAGQDEQILSSDVHGVINCWETKTGKVVYHWKDDSDFSSFLACFEVQQSADCAITVRHNNQSREPIVSIWNLSRRFRIRRLQFGHSDLVSCCAINPSGTYVVTGSTDHSAIIWQKETAQPIRVLQGHVDAVQEVAFSPDGESVASCGLDRTVRLWDVRTGKALRVYRGHSDIVFDVAFHPTNSRVASVSLDGTVRQWDLDKDQRFESFSHPDQPPLTTARMSADNKYIVTGGIDGKLFVWDRNTHAITNTFREHTDYITTATFSPRDKYLLASGADDGIVYLWNVETGLVTTKVELVKTKDDCVNHVTSIDFNSDGTLMAIAYDNRVGLYGLSGKVTGAVPSFESTVEAVAFSPDGRFLACGCFDGAVLIWDVKAQEVHRSINGHTDVVRAVAFSENGSSLASGGRNQVVKVWSVVTGQLRHELKGHTQQIYSLSFTPDGKRLVSAGGDSQRRIGEVKIWDWQTETELLALVGHTATVHNVQFSTNSLTLVTASDDGTAKLWSAVDWSR